MGGGDRKNSKQIPDKKNTKSNLALATESNKNSTQVAEKSSGTQLIDRGSGSKRRTIFLIENAPIVPSEYDDKMRKLVNSNPVLLSNRVHISWYRRFAEVLPEKEQTNFQPFREIQTRDEDIALQHQFGTHECMHELVQKGVCRLPQSECKRIRELAMARYTRIKKREEEKKERGPHGAQDPADAVFTLPGQDIDLTTEFGFSANKKKVVLPVVDFLMKLHVNRERNVARRSISPDSRWLKLKVDPLKSRMSDMVKIMKKNAARNRIQRLFNLVLCVDRFIKCVAMIAGDTQTLLKDTTIQKPVVPPQVMSSRKKSERELNFFNVHDYQKVGQIQVPFHIQMILTKPWFCRSNKEVETAVNFLEKMRCFTAYPRQFQFMLARVAWYIELPTQKVIIRQCQQAVNFYLLLNGSVRIDRLEGSPWEGSATGRFRTINNLTSQDMFGDECITQPFSERWYTATSEEKCAVLDFNMHDYNNMIQTANTSEEAPDHIRFLCKLRIMDAFPKIKLLQEQDTNVTYFFFRPGMLVCKSVKDSPYVFVVRNGSCSSLFEIKPKIDFRRVIAEHANSDAKSSKRTSSNLKRSASAKLSGKGDVRTGRLQTIKSIREGSGETGGIFDEVIKKMNKDDSSWFDKTKSHFESSKSGLKDHIQEYAEKSEQLITSIGSDEMLANYNLGSRSNMSSHTDVGLNVDRRSSRRSSTLRWKIDGQDVVGAEDGGSEKSQDKESKQSSRHSSRQGSRASISNLPPVDSRRSSIVKMQSKDRLERAGSVGRLPKMVGTNIPLTVDNMLSDKLSKHSQLDDNNSANSWKFSANNPYGRVNEKNNIRGRPTITANSFLRYRKSDLMTPVSRYSQWKQKAILTVTDTAGVEWLDYNDGTYKEPKEDYSLVSHGATIIMIKKEFMLKYLRKEW